MAEDRAVNPSPPAGVLIKQVSTPIGRGQGMMKQSEPILKETKPMDMDNHLVLVAQQ